MNGNVKQRRAAARSGEWAQHFSNASCFSARELFSFQAEYSAHVAPNPGDATGYEQVNEWMNESSIKSPSNKHEWSCRELGYYLVCLTSSVRVCTVSTQLAEHHRADDIVISLPCQQLVTNQWSNCYPPATYPPPIFPQFNVLTLPLSVCVSEC